MRSSEVASNCRGAGRCAGAAGEAADGLGLGVGVGAGTGAGAVAGGWTGAATVSDLVTVVVDAPVGAGAEACVRAGRLAQPSVTATMATPRMTTRAAPRITGPPSQRSMIRSWATTIGLPHHQIGRASCRERV